MTRLATRERRRQSLVKHLARRDDLYAKAVNAGDLRTALAIADSEAKLRRLFPAEKHRLKVKGRTCKRLLRDLALGRKCGAEGRNQDLVSKRWRGSRWR